MDGPEDVTYRYADVWRRRKRTDLDGDADDGQQRAAERNGPQACRCAVLLRPLEDGDDLPDHVCRSTAESACRRWAVGNLQLHLPVTPGGAVMFGSASVPLGDGHLVRCTGITGDPAAAKGTPVGALAPGHPVWPAMTDLGAGSPGSRHLVLVLSRWVETDMGEKRSDALTKRLAWADAEAWVRRTRGKTPGPIASRVFEAQMVLSSLGLPHNPGVARKLLGLEQTISEGLLLTVAVVTQHPWDGVAERILPASTDDMIYSVAGSAVFTRSDTFRACHAALDGFKRWWFGLEVARGKSLAGTDFNARCRSDDAMAPHVAAVVQGDATEEDAFAAYFGQLQPHPGPVEKAKLWGRFRKRVRRCCQKARR